MIFIQVKNLEELDACLFSQGGGIKPGEGFYISTAIGYGLGLSVVKQFQDYLEKKTAPKKIPLWVDCGIYPGLALGAFSEGLKHVIFRGETVYHRALKSLAAQQGAKLVIPSPENK